jgi:hypothetical protein
MSTTYDLNVPTEREARFIVHGIQTGNVDEIDLIGMIEDYEDWVALSVSSTASNIRVQRKEGR